MLFDELPIRSATPRNRIVGRLSDVPVLELQTIGTWFILVHAR